MKDLPIDKFTQEVKDAWIEALESGEYTQGQFQLENKINNKYYCCLGVLGEIHDKLFNEGRCNDNTIDPYSYIDKTLGLEMKKLLVKTNDSTKLIKPDYSNVLPLIKSLKVQI
jgi:hypothetical protein